MTAATRTERALLAVDAGGSRTRVLVALGGERCSWETGSINRHAAGPAADRTLRHLFTAITDILASRPVAGWIASASVDPDDAGPELKRLAAVAAAAAPAGQATALRLLASNDVMPLLWGVPALAGQGVAVVCGTGSCFLGANQSGQVVRAGGCEYLGSDEGSAAHLGWRGLCAAVRAADGRGPQTALVPALSAGCGGNVAWLARQLAAQPFPKQRLAALAPAVCAAWCDGDQVATSIVHDALAELATGVRAVRDVLGLRAGFAVTATGGVLTGCPEFFAALSQAVRAEVGAGQVVLVDDTPAVTLAALAAVLDRDALPAYVWAVTPEAP